MKIGTDLNCETRTLAQSDQRHVVEIGASFPDRISGRSGAQGRFKQLGIRPGLVASLYDFSVSANFDGASHTDPCLSIATFITATGTGIIDQCLPGHPDIRVPYASGYTYLSFMPVKTFGRYEIPSGARFFGIEIRATLEFLQRLGALSLFEAVSASHPMHLVSTEQVWIGRLPTAQLVKASALRLLNAGFESGDDLSVEARSLDILTTALAVMREPLFCGGVHLLRDARKLDAARALMMADLSRPWTVAKVAREVGLTEKRLKTGFRQHFGVAVHGFLQHSRLNHAKAMLERRDASVTEIALAVGYANPSHFAHLFRREFGFRPSDYAASFGR